MVRPHVGIPVDSIMWPTQLNHPSPGSRHVTAKLILQLESLASTILASLSSNPQTSESDLQKSKTSWAEDSSPCFRSYPFYINDLQNLRA